MRPGMTVSADFSGPRWDLCPAKQLRCLHRQELSIVQGQYLEEVSHAEARVLIALIYVALVPWLPRVAHTWRAVPCVRSCCAGLQHGTSCQSSWGPHEFALLAFAAPVEHGTTPDLRARVISAAPHCGSPAAAFPMSFLRHREIYAFDEGAIPRDRALPNRKDEFPAGYSLAGRTPREPASASPADAILQENSS